jgi:Secretion system C-terminal sorting domain
LIGVNKTVQYEAKESIFAGSNVTGGTQGNLDIKDNSNITFAAGKSIVLKPGFSVKAGSTFRSYIKDFSCPAISQMNMVSASKHNLNADNTNINTHDKVEVAPPLVDMKNSNGVRISPNPTDGDFSVSIEGADQQKIKIQLYNLIGSLVYNDFVCLDQSKTISLNKQPAGIYLIKIIDHKGKIKTGKIIKL